MVRMLIKKIKHSIYIALICLGFWANAQAKVVVFACEPEWAALAQEIGGDLLSVTTATHAKQDPHHIEARPSLIAQARKADLVVGTGAELEDGWLPMILQKANNPKILKNQPGYLMMADFVTLKKHPQLKSTANHIDRSQGDVHAAGNPHIQLDPRLYLVFSKVLAERLSQIDPQKKAVYQTNYVQFNKKWEAKLRHWAQLAEPLKNMKIVVYHDNWVYLNDWLGLNQVTTLEPKPGVPPSAAYLKTVLSTIMQTGGVKAILHTPFEPVDAVNWLNQKTSIRVIALPFTVGGNTESKELAGFFDNIMQQLLLGIKT